MLQLRRSRNRAPDWGDGSAATLSASGGAPHKPVSAPTSNKKGGGDALGWSILVDTSGNAMADEWSDLNYNKKHANKQYKQKQTRTRQTQHTNKCKMPFSVERKPRQSQTPSSSIKA